jgi:hypothetical protein
MSGFTKGGTFEVWNVDPGRYFLTARWTSGGQRVQTAPVEIEVGESNIENVELRVIPPSDVSGQMVFEDDQARPQPSRQNQETKQGDRQQADGPRPRVELRTVDPGMFAEPVVSDVSEDGSFHLAGVKAARYRVMLSWTSAYVKAVTLGSTVMEGNVLNLRNGGSAAIGAVEFGVRLCRGDRYRRRRPCRGGTGGAAAGRFCVARRRDLHLHGYSGCVRNCQPSARQIPASRRGGGER